MRISELLECVRAAQSLTSFFEHGYVPSNETLDKAHIPRSASKYWKR